MAKLESSRKSPVRARDMKIDWEVEYHTSPDKSSTSWDARRDVLKGVLVSSMERGENLVPASNDHVLVLMVNGTIDYTGGKVRLAYGNFRLRDRLELEMFEYFQKNVNPAAVSPKILASIVDTVRPEQHYAPPDHPYWSSHLAEIYNHPLGGILQGPSTGWTSLPYDVVAETRESILPSFEPAERKDLEGIGRFVRKFIEEDSKPGKKMRI